MRIVSLLFLVFFINSAISQTDFNEKIIGTWQFDTVVGDISNAEKDTLMSTDVLLTFREDDSLIMEVGDFALVVTYELDDTLLIIGKNQYIITKIEDDTMSFEHNADGISLRYTYKRKPRDE
ncbi:hypothetical protein U8527_12900 [Kordia algicida OT-1]|uniref:Lipocalin-like domain-containing protein n=1 Tax=Kordia algicida OT-1 TaxID=391587 RepID=A9E4L5_9FLAO|nr:hypothetical protein [Kordia algicida]EDP95107.1 hypothetical protein KAOT1_06477 [Kordia algicida OT-1]